VIIVLLYNWLMNAVKAKGGAKALIYRDTYLSWRGLCHRVDRRADEFESMGVRSGDVVGVMLGNVPDFLILSLALSKLKAAPLPLDPTTSTRELEMIMSILPLRGMITRPRGGDAPVPQGPTLPGDPAKKQTPETRRRLQGTLLSCSIYATEERSVPRKIADQIAAVLVTTDSAGDPKPVERTVANLTAEAESLVRALDLKVEDRALLTLPLFHAFGFDLGMAAALSIGMTLYLEDELAPARITKLLREQKITVFPSSSVTLFSELARLPASRPLDHEPIRLLSLGGSLSGATLENFRKKYGVRPLSCFHSSETGTISLDATGKAGQTVGTPLEGIELRITSQSTKKPVSGSRKGTLWVRGPSISPLKLCSLPPAGKDIPVGGRDKEGWYRTGDIASIDKSGRLILKGREDDLVQVDGRRVALGEVEGCIETHPRVSVAQAEVVTDPFAGPIVVAKIVTRGRGKIDTENIIDHCAKNLSPYKVPRRIEICESL